DLEAFDSDALLIVTIPGDVGSSALDSIVEARRDRATLFVLPKWLTVPLPGHQGWEMSFGRLPYLSVSQMLSRLSPQQLGPGVAKVDRIDMAGVEVSGPDNLQTAETLLPEVAAGPGQAVLIRGKDTAHYVLTDPDLLDNAALKDKDKAAA